MTEPTNTATTQEELAMQLKELNEREVSCRKEITTLRAKRETLKSILNIPASSERPDILNKVPKYFWWPAYKVGMFFSELNPYKDKVNTPPDLDDWHKKGGVKEAVTNVLVGAVMTVVFLKIMQFFA
jgi:hypothetical protein